MEKYTYDALQSLKWALVCATSDSTLRRVIWSDYVASQNRRGYLNNFEATLVGPWIELNNPPEL